MRLRHSHAGAVTAAFIVVAFQGCATPPSTTEMAEDYREGRSLALETFDQMRVRCHQDYTAGSAELNACLDAAHEWYRTHMAEVNKIYRDALDGKWNSVRQRRERLERELLEMLPNFEELKDLFELVSSESSMIGVGNGVHRSTFFPSDMPGAIGNPVPIETETYDFSGSFQITRNDVVDEATIGGSLDLHITQAGLESSGKVVSGLLTATFTNNETIQMTVIKKAGNTFNTDSSGVGSLSVWVDLQHSINEWDSIMFDTNRLTFDLRIDVSGQMILTPPAPRDHTPMPHSDYNNDGQLEYNTDFGAYLLGHAAHSDDADINADGIWDQEDIDLWIGDFLYDERNLQ